MEEGENKGDAVGRRPLRLLNIYTFFIFIFIYPEGFFVN